MSAHRDNPARQTSLREHNLALTLAQLADHGPTSRARLAAVTGLTKATVSSLVDSLVAGGLVAELGPSAAPRVGRPGSQVALSGSGPVGIGLEINVDYLATMTVDLSGTVRQRETITGDLRASQPGTVLARAAMALRRAVERAQIGGAQVAGVAVAVPGLVETDLDLLRMAANLGWRDVAVLDELRARSEGALPEDLVLTLDNEANLAALAELWCGGHASRDGSPLRTFVHISGEIGIGAGIVVDGALYRGRHGFSGEIGHLTVGLPRGKRDRPEAECSCGRQGCLEQLAGQEAILRAAGFGEPARTGWRLGGLGTSRGTPDGPVAALEEAARQGDRRTVTALAEAGTALGGAIAAVLNIVDADAVVLGGLYARLATWMVPTVEAEIAHRALISAWSPVQLRVSPLGGEAAVLGAAMSVVRAVIADPAAYLAARGGVI
jgi:predicted NBD/HSP70 family sugar kinase